MQVLYFICAKENYWDRKHKTSFINLIFEYIYKKNYLTYGKKKQQFILF